MKAIEIIPLAKRKLQRRGIPEAWVVEALEKRIRSLKDTAVVWLRSGVVEFVDRKSSFELFSRKLLTNTW